MSRISKLTHIFGHGLESLIVDYYTDLFTSKGEDDRALQPFKTMYY